MASEAHDCLARYVRTSMIRSAHQAGVRRLTTEALPWPAPDTQGPLGTSPLTAAPPGSSASRLRRRSTPTLAPTPWSSPPITRSPNNPARTTRPPPQITPSRRHRPADRTTIPARLRQFEPGAMPKCRTAALRALPPEPPATLCNLTYDTRGGL